MLERPNFLKAILFPIYETKVSEEYTNYLRTILPSSCSGLTVLNESMLSQKKELLDLLKSMDDDLLLISADNLPTWGTLQLIEKSVNKKTRALTFRPKDGFVSDWIVEGEEILATDSAQIIEYKGNSISGGVAVIALEDRNNLELFFSSSDDSDTNDAHCSSFHKMIDYLVHTSNIRSIDCKEFEAIDYRCDKSFKLTELEIPSRAEEKRKLRNSCVKVGDNFWTEVAISPWTKYVASALSKTKVTPNQVTVFSFLLAFLAAACFSLSSQWLGIVGAVLVFLSFAADCVDGQLARLTGRFTDLGEWLDLTSDRIKEVILIAGLAIGASQEDKWSWFVASFMLITMSMRAQVNQSYELHRCPASAKSYQAELPALGYVSYEYRAKNFFTLPYGNRMGLITLCALFSNSQTVLWVLLTWNTVAFVYQITGRLRRGACSAVHGSLVLSDHGSLMRLMTDSISRVNGIGLLLVQISLTPLLFFDKILLWLLAIVVIGACGANSPKGKLEWVGPICSMVSEFAILASLFSRSEIGQHWIIFSAFCVTSIIRLSNSTQIQLKQPHNTAPTKTGLMTVLGWEGRVLILVIAFSISRTLMIVIISLLLIKLLSQMIREAKLFTQK